MYITAQSAHIYRNIAMIKSPKKTSTMPMPKQLNPHQNDQGRKGSCFFQRLIALKCLKCQKIKKNI